MYWYSISGPNVVPFDENFSEGKLCRGSGVTFLSSQTLGDGTYVSPQSTISGRDMESSSSHSSPKAVDQNSSEEKQKDSNDESRWNNKLSIGNGCTKTMESPGLKNGERSSSDTGIGTRTGSDTRLVTSQDDYQSITMDSEDTKPQMMLKPTDTIPTIAVTSMDESSFGVSSDYFYRKQSHMGKKESHYTWANTGALDLSWQKKVGDTAQFTAPTSRKRSKEHGVAVIRPASSPSINNNVHISIDIESLINSVQSLASINASDCQSDSPPRKSRCEDAHYSSSILNYISKFNSKQFLKNQRQFEAERAARAVGNPMVRNDIIAAGVRSFNTSRYFSTPRQMNQAERIHFGQPGTDCNLQSSHQNHNVFNLSTNGILTRETPESWALQVPSYNRSVSPPAFPFIDAYRSCAEMSMASESSGFKDQMLAASQAILTKSSQIKNCHQHICHFCGKMFHRAANLKRHIRTHSGERPYVCNTCARAFSVSSKLQHHIRRIHRDQTFIGDEVTVNPTVGETLTYLNVA